MAIHSVRPVFRLSQWDLRTLGLRRTGLYLPSNQRVAALHHLFTSRREWLPTSIRRRNFATDRPVSRPKAHTGRTTTAAKKAPTTSATKAAKKPAVKKTSAKAIPKTKSKAKPRIKAKPNLAKKAKAKAKAKPKPKKPLTEAQKTKKVIADLKVTALTPPGRIPSTAWSVFTNENLKKGSGSVATQMKDLAARWKNVSPEQLEVRLCSS